MKTKDIVALLKDGKKPMVRLTGHLWDDSWNEAGMLARITAFTEQGHDDLIELTFDYNEKKEHNLSLQPKGYYIYKDGVDTGKTGTAFDAGQMDEKDIKEEVVFGEKDDVPIELAEGNKIIAEYMRSGSKVSYVEWLEAKLEELVPDSMKEWKEGP